MLCPRLEDSNAAKFVILNSYSRAYASEVKQIKNFYAMISMRNVCINGERDMLGIYPLMWLVIEFYDVANRGLFQMAILGLPLDTLNYSFKEKNTQQWCWLMDWHTVCLKAN